jgi:hypothetical protein
MGSRRSAKSKRQEESVISNMLDRISEKAVSGKALTIVISLITALIALVLLWAFLTKQMPLITESIENIITGLRNAICEKFGMIEILCKAVI